MPLPEFTIKHYAGKVIYQVSPEIVGLAAGAAVLLAAGDTEAQHWPQTFTPRSNSDSAVPKLCDLEQIA